MNRSFITSFIVLLSLITIKDARINSTPDAVTKCTGETVTLHWTYSNKLDLRSITWTKWPVMILTYVEGTGSTSNTSYSGRVTNSDGALTLSTLESKDSGIYVMTVLYNNSTIDASAVTLTVYDVLNQTLSATMVDSRSRNARLICILPKESTGLSYEWTNSRNKTVVKERNLIVNSCGTYTCSLSGPAASCIEPGLQSEQSLHVTGFICPSNTCYGISFGIGFGIWGLFIGLPISILSSKEKIWGKKKKSLIITVVCYAVLGLILILAVSLTVCFKLRDCNCMSLEIRTGCGIGLGCSLIPAAIEVLILILLARSCASHNLSWST